MACVAFDLPYLPLPLFRQDNCPLFRRDWVVRTIAVGGDPSTGEWTINLTSSSRPSRVENKRHKRHTCLKALQDKGSGVWRFGRANATNATQTPPNATPMGSTAGHVAIVPLAGERGSFAATVAHPAFCPQLGSCRPGGSLHWPTLPVNRDIGASPEDAGQRPVGVGMESLSPATPRRAGSCLQLITPI